MNQSEEMTKQFSKIFEESNDSIEQAKGEIKKRREEILKDKDFII